MLTVCLKKIYSKDTKNIVGLGIKPDFPKKPDITIGETILPNNIPSLNQILFSGVRIFELNNPNNKKIILTTSDQILKFPSFNRG